MNNTEIRGEFRAVVTQDAQAHGRDGQTFVDAHPLTERVPQSTGALWEIQFADGEWMLARTPDLTFAG